MAVKKTFYPIPANTPYEGGARLFLVCVPDDQVWMTAFRESVRQLTRGRYWDRETGRITEAQQTGREIYGSIMDCTDILTRLDNIASAINGLSLTTSLSVSCCDMYSAPAPPTPEPDQPPPGGGPVPPPPPYPDPGSYDAELCRVANAVHWLITRYLTFLSALDVAAAVLALLVAGLAIIFPEPATTAIGGIALTSIISAILLVDGGLQTVSAWADAALVVWESEHQQFVTTFYQAYGNVAAWGDTVVNFVENNLVQAVTAVSLPSSVESKLFAWLENFLSWVADVIYNYSGELDDHPNPLPCAPTALKTWHFDAAEDLYYNPRTTLYTAESCVRLSPNSLYFARVGIDATTWATAGLVAGNYTNVRIRVLYCQGPDNNQDDPPPWTLEMIVKDAATANYHQVAYNYDGKNAPVSLDPDSDGVWITFEPEVDVMCQGGGYYFTVDQLPMLHTGHFRVGKIEFYGDIV